MDDAVFHVNVLPPQAHHLRAPQTEEEAQIDRRFDGIALDRFQQSLCCSDIVGGALEVIVAVVLHRNVRAGIVVELSHGDGLGENAVEDHQMLADALSGQTRVLFRPDVLHNDPRCHVTQLQLLLFEVGLDVDFIGVEIGFVGIRTDLLFLHRQPVLDRLNQILVRTVALRLRQGFHPFRQHEIRFVFVRGGLPLVFALDLDSCGFGFLF